MSDDMEETPQPQNESQGNLREQLAEMSFEDLQKLQSKLGSKVYNRAVFGQQKTKKKPAAINHKRDKDAPLEMSAKRQVSRFRATVPVHRHTAARDPRFDSLCGTYDEKQFKKAYGFLTKVKENDLNALKKELKATEDPEIIKKIKYLIQRLENQLREEARKVKKEEQAKAEKAEIAEALKKGEKPTYKKKSEKKILNLISQYEELKDSGKLKKHIQRLRKKNLAKERKSFSKGMKFDH